MKKSLPTSSAFTLIEIIIVMAIILILTTAAITGTSKVLKNLRFTNSFNKVVFMIQKARDLAISGKQGGNSTTNYLIELDTSNNFMTIQAEGTSGPREEVEGYYVLNNNKGYQLFANDVTSGSTQCPIIVWIKFEIYTGKILVNCPGGPSPPAKVMEIGLREIPVGPATREQTLLFHRATGIPQVQKIITN